MRLILLCASTVFLQSCLTPLFWLVAGNGLAQTPEVCESCKVEAAAVDHTADAVPKFMEESRARLGPTATTERTGHFSWEVSLQGQPVSACGARVHDGWHCEPLKNSSPPQL